MVRLRHLSDYILGFATDNIAVSSISWLENDIFLMIYTPNAAEDDMGQNPPSSYYIITRRKQAPFLIQKMPELCGPFGLKRTPAYQFIGRLRDYKPHLKDVLVVSSTASTDVGLITRADQPLSKESAAQGTVNLFTTTEVSDDTKRACLPLRDSVDETSAIGLGVDLSSTEKVVSPIQGEDILESSTPLPNVLILNNDGILCSWWFIYSEAIRQNVPYQGLASATAQPQPQLPAQPAQPAQPAAQPPPALSGFGKPSALGGGQEGKPAFGNPSTLGGGQASSFGVPSFGTPSFGNSFGQPSALNRDSAQFGKTGFGSAAPSFGQSSAPGKGLQSIGFNASSGGGGFGSFASGSAGGFAGFAAAKSSGESPFTKAAGESPFGKPATESPFGKPSTTTESPFGKPATESPFGKMPAANPFGKPSIPSPFGQQTGTNTAFPTQNVGTSNGSMDLGKGGFQLGSTFKPDGTAANDLPKPDKPSGGGMFSLGTSLDEMVSTPDKGSPPAESMDDGEDVSAAEPTKPAAPTSAPAPSIFGAPKMTTPAAPPATSSPFSFTKPAEQNQPKAPFSLFGNNAPAKGDQASEALSPPSEKTAVPCSTPKKEESSDADKTPEAEPAEPPLPPEPTSRDVYGPGDTSASSNVSKESIEEAPLPPDFTAKPKATEKEPAKEPPLPPDFAAKPKETKKVIEEAPLPPEPATPATPASVAGPPEDTSPVPDESDADEDENEQGEEEEDEEGDEDDDESAKETVDGEGAEESDFADSGEDITHDISHDDLQSPKTSLESSFGGPESATQSPAGGLFSKIPTIGGHKKQPSQSNKLFGEVKQPIFPPKSQAPLRSPSPVRPGGKKSSVKLDGQRKPSGPGDALAARKASLKEFSVRDNQQKARGTDFVAQEQQARFHAEAQRREEEELALSDDDEDERLRADLSQPLEPVPTLDPFLPHHDYAGETSKPGVPGQIERLYRDINSMVDTLGINARSLGSFLLYQKQSPQDNANWIETLKSDNPGAVLDEKFLLSHIEKLDDAVAALAGCLQEQRVQGVEEKLDSCRQLLGKDILALRSQCANIRKTLDAHVDSTAIAAAPLSPEQASLQQDLRSTSTSLQAKLADLEQEVSLLRAKLADAPRPDGANGPMKRPTVEAVSSTIATMMNMVESKSGDIDVLEVQLKKLGIDTSASPSVRSREGSPFTTPKKGGLRNFPTTPGSRGSPDGSLSAYHTPDSASRGVNFRSSINGSARASRLRSVEGVGEMAGKSDSERWRAKTQRRQHLVGGLKKAIEEKKSKVRGVDDM